MTGSASSAAEKTPDPMAAFAERIVARHIRSVSRAITLIENGDPRIRVVLDALVSVPGRAKIIGVTGVPGAGKSTLVPALAKAFSAGEQPVAVLAVDPSSPLSGGAILGDRIRDTTGGNASIFYRSIASRGSLGGLSRTLDDVVTLLEAAGFSTVLIETVGTGQSEVAVTRLAHTTLMLTAPGLGDEVQAMKAGILEVADFIIVNKADSDPRGAEMAALTLRQAISETQRAHGLSEGSNNAEDPERAAWLAPVRTISAARGQGVDELGALILDHRRFLEASHTLAKWREQRLLERFMDGLRNALLEEMLSSHRARFEAISREVAEGGISPLRAAAQLAEMAVGRTPGWQTQGGKDE